MVEEVATAKQIGQVVSADKQLVDLVVQDSRRAYESDWRYHSPRERAQVLHQVAAKIREHSNELAELKAREVGKPKRDALRFDISYCHACFDYFAGLADTLHGGILDQGVIEARVLFEPYGVVAAILPFTWPPIHFAKKSAPALAAGNIVVVKPGELLQSNSASLRHRLHQPNRDEAKSSLTLSIFSGEDQDFQQNS